jgi:hypothetical protein
MRVFIPVINKSSMSRHTRGSKQGRGIGGVLLDNGLGGQSSYSSVDDYLATTKRNLGISGSGIKGLDSIRNKMESLVIKPSSRKPKNIKFSL